VTRNKREPTSERHPSDELVENLRLSVEAAAGMSVDGMIRGLCACAAKCRATLAAQGPPEEIVTDALSAATMALALFQSLDDFKRHKTGTGLELGRFNAKGNPS
jgi:hypothetical protein